ncbi:hypothetical protein [Helicobacter cetorum]|uniref:hypothetical protein n=1 Tax=Helicobacter cetorum TaxID=138563 RepID=UPI000CF04309|nr:hypothetical protein [Helicobacter cetorum]
MSIKPLQALRLPIEHPLVEILCDKALKNKSELIELFNFDFQFKNSVQTLEREKFKRALKVVGAIYSSLHSNNVSEEIKGVVERCENHHLISKEFIEETLQIISEQSVYMDFKEFKEYMLEVDYIAIGIDKYEQTRLEDLDAGHWDLSVSCEDKDCVTFRFDGLDDKKIYARSSLLDVNKSSIVAIDFGTKSTVAGYMDKQGVYRLISIGDNGNESSKKYENPTVVEFRHKDRFKKRYKALEHRPFTEKDDIEIAYEAQKDFESASGNEFYRFFSKLKQWAGTDERQNFKDFEDDFTLESFLECDKFNPIEIYAYYIGRYINNMNNGVFLRYYLSYPIKYEKQYAQKIRESFEKGLKKSLPSHIFEDEKMAKNFKVELRASEPSAYAISALKSYGFFNKEKLDKPIYYGVFDFGGGTTDFDFGKWEKSEDKKYSYRLVHFSNEGDKYLGGENLLELLAWEVYGQNFEFLKAESIVIAKPNYENVDTQRYDSLTKNSREAKRNLLKIAYHLRPFLEKLDSKSLGAIEDDEEVEIEGFDTEPKIQLFNKDGESKECNLSIDCQELLKILRDKIEKGVKDFFAELIKVISHADEHGIKELQKFHIFLGGNASKSILVKQAFEKQIRELKEDYQKESSKDDLEFYLFEPLGTKESDEQILEITGNDVSNEPAYKKATCKTGVAFGLLESRSKPNGIDIESVGNKEPKFKYDLGLDNGEGHFEIKVARESLRVGEWVLLFSKEEWIEQDSLELRYSDKSGSSNLPIEETSLCNIPLAEAYEGVDIKVRCIDSKSIEVGVFRDNELLSSEVEILDTK